MPPTSLQALERATTNPKKRKQEQQTVASEPIQMPAGDKPRETDMGGHPIKRVKKTHETATPKVRKDTAPTNSTAKPTGNLSRGIKMLNEVPPQKAKNKTTKNGIDEVNVALVQIRDALVASGDTKWQSVVDAINPRFHLTLTSATASARYKRWKPRCDELQLPVLSDLSFAAHDASSEQRHHISQPKQQQPKRKRPQGKEEEEQRQKKRQKPQEKQEQQQHHEPEDRILTAVELEQALYKAFMDDDDDYDDHIESKNAVPIPAREVKHREEPDHADIPKHSPSYVNNIRPTNQSEERVPVNGHNHQACNSPTADQVAASTSRDTLLPKAIDPQSLQPVRIEVQQENIISGPTTSVHNPIPYKTVNMQVEHKHQNLEDYKASMPDDPEIERAHLSHMDRQVTFHYSDVNSTGLPFAVSRQALCEMSEKVRQMFKQCPDVTGIVIPMDTKVETAGRLKQCILIGGPRKILPEYDIDHKRIKWTFDSLVDLLQLSHWFGTDCVSDLVIDQIHQGFLVNGSKATAIDLQRLNSFESDSHSMAFLTDLIATKMGSTEGLEDKQFLCAPARNALLRSLKTPEDRLLGPKCAMDRFCARYHHHQGSSCYKDTAISDLADIADKVLDIGEDQKLDAHGPVSPDDGTKQSELGSRDLVNVDKVLEKTKTTLAQAEKAANDQRQGPSLRQEALLGLAQSILSNVEEKWEMTDAKASS